MRNILKFLEDVLGGAARLAGGLLGSGTLEVGAAADLVLWDRDLHATPAHALAKARPRLTTLDGGIVYEFPQGPRDDRAAKGAGPARDGERSR